MRSGTHYDSSEAESAMNDLPAQEEIAESEPAEATSYPKQTKAPALSCGGFRAAGKFTRPAQPTLLF